MKLSSVPKLRKRNEKQEALRSLGVSPEQLKTAPEISSYLKEIRGGVNLVIKSLRFSTDPIAIAFLEKYDSISPRWRKNMPIEAIALAAEVDIKTLLGVVLIAVREDSASRVKILAMTSHPAVYRKRIEFAKRPKGYRDRDALDTLLGALPSPKGTTFIGKIINNASTDEDGDGPENDEDYIFPDASEIQERIQGKQRKFLESGK